MYMCMYMDSMICLFRYTVTGVLVWFVVCYSAYTFDHVLLQGSNHVGVLKGKRSWGGLYQLTYPQTIQYCAYALLQQSMGHHCKSFTTYI